MGVCPRRVIWVICGRPARHVKAGLLNEMTLTNVLFICWSRGLVNPWCSLQNSPPWATLRGQLNILVSGHLNLIVLTRVCVSCLNEPKLETCALITGMILSHIDTTCPPKFARVQSNSYCTADSDILQRLPRLRTPCQHFHSVHLPTGDQYMKSQGDQKNEKIYDSSFKIPSPPLFT